MAKDPKPRQGVVRDPVQKPVSTNTYDYIPAPITTELPVVSVSYLPAPNVINNTEPPRTNQLAITAGKQGDPEPYIFGRCIADPVIVAADDSGQWLYVDMLWSVGEIDYLEYLLVNNASVGRADGLGKVQHFEGTTTQTASTIMVGLKGAYDALVNKAHSIVPLLVGEGLIEKAMIRGIKLYDPRTSPGAIAYSTNPALAVARLFSDCGYTLDWDSVGTAADYCDELIGVSSPQVKRWEIGGQIKVRKDISAWAHTLAQYANCFIDIQNGIVTLTPDAPRSSNHTVTAADMISGTVRLSHPRGNNVPDAIEVSGKLADGTRIQYTYGTSTGAGSETKLNMPFYQSGHTIGRKGEETYRKSRMRTLEFTGFDNGLKRTIGDLGTITNAQYGLSSAAFALVEQKQLSGGRWRRKYVEYSASNYSDIIYTVDTNFTLLYDPNQPPAGPTPTATEELITVGGVTQSRFKITFTGIQWAYLQDYTVKVYSLATGAVILETAVASLGITTHTTYTTGPVESGITYRVEVRVRSVTNATGTAGTVDTSSTLAPSSFLTYGNLTNMHVYILDGDGQFCTSSNAVTWSSRFTSSPLGAWTAGETWLGDQLFQTTFETEAWDSGNTWDGLWKFTDLDISELGGATRGNFVSLSASVSPLSFTDYAGTSHSAEAQWMKVKCTVTDSPLSAGDGLHVRLPVPVSFTLGA
ncbi:hypothetical protein N9937_01155 [bacterium]|nr:hypothetical protein [bacterium]